MWKNYSLSYLKHNKAASIFIMLTVLIASLFISALSAVFYNIWTDNNGRIAAEEGDWQGRLRGHIGKEELEKIGNYPGVSHLVLEAGEDGIREVSVYLDNPRTIYTVLPRIAEEIGLDTGRYSEAVSYHSKLLTQYYIYSPEEKKSPPLLLSLYLLILLAVCLSMMLIIHHAFEITADARLRQLGILQSVGASPKQIAAVLFQEFAVLSTVPILLGIDVGILFDCGFIRLSNLLGNGLTRQAAVFRYHPAVFLITFGACVLTVCLAAARAAARLSRVTPMEALAGKAERPVKKVKTFRLASLLFGVEGELAAKSLYVRRRTLRASFVSLTLSFLAFGIFLNFIALSELSVKQTYFERYKDTWDLMAAVNAEQGTDGEMQKLLSDMREIPDVADVTAYRKITAYTRIPEERLSERVRALGGLEVITKQQLVKENGSYLLKVPLVILDDRSFQSYGWGAELGMITLNRIWVSSQSDFRNREYVPLLEETDSGELLLSADTDLESAVSVKIAAYAGQEPDLREEYENFSLVQIMPESVFQEIEAYFGADENGSETVYYNILADSEEQIPEIRRRAARLLDGMGGVDGIGGMGGVGGVDGIAGMDGGLEYELESRPAQESYNARVMRGYKLIVGILCTLLALIGLANVLAATLGGIYLRRREFARYLSVGMTPSGIRKMMCLEALRIVAKPVFVSLPVHVGFVLFAVRASHIRLRDFLEAAPVLPLTVFLLFLLACVGAAYAAGGRAIWRGNIMDSLKDDAMQ